MKDIVFWGQYKDWLNKKKIQSIYIVTIKKKKKNLCYMDFSHCFIKKIKIHSLIDIFFNTL